MRHRQSCGSGAPLQTSLRVSAYTGVCFAFSHFVSPRPKLCYHAPRCSPSSRKGTFTSDQGDEESERMLLNLNSRLSPKRSVQSCHAPAPLRVLKRGLGRVLIFAPLRLRGWHRAGPVSGGRSSAQDGSLDPHYCSQPLDLRPTSSSLLRGARCLILRQFAPDVLNSKVA